MAIEPTCNRCRRPLDEPGGLAFSPPSGAVVVKYHLCVTCWSVVVEWIAPPAPVPLAPASLRDLAVSPTRPLGRDGGDGE